MARSKKARPVDKFIGGLYKVDEALASLISIADDIADLEDTISTDYEYYDEEARGYDQEELAREMPKLVKAKEKFLKELQTHLGIKLTT